MVGSLSDPAATEPGGLEAHLAPVGSADYYLARLLPAPARRSVRALLGLQREWQGLLTRPGDPGVRRLRLYWWRQHLQTHNDPAGNRHPLLRALDDDGRLPPSALYPRLLRAHTAFAERLDWTSVATAESLWQQLHAGEGELGVLLLEFTQGRALSDTSACQTLATALAWLETLEAARGWARRGASPIPMAWAAAEGLAHEALIAGPTGPAWTRLAARYLQYALAPAEAAWSELCASQGRAALGLRIHALYVVERMRLIREGGFAVFQQGTDLTPLRYLLLALAGTYLGWQPRFQRLAR